ncbi:MAG: hypothetical protein WBH47_10585 [Streptosporangiaceae bacterium]
MPEVIRGPLGRNPVFDLELGALRPRYLNHQQRAGDGEDSVSKEAGPLGGLPGLCLLLCCAGWHVTLALLGCRRLLIDKDHGQRRDAASA